MKARYLSSSSNRFLIVLLTSMLEFYVTCDTESQVSWREMLLPVSNPNLSFISFADSNHGCLSGKDGTFLYTSDNGQNWVVDSIPLPSPSQLSVDKCELVSTDVAWGYAVQQNNPQHWGFFRSIDRGQTWLRVDPPATVAFLGASFVSQSVAYAVSRTQFWATTDGGTTWLQRGQPLHGTVEFTFRHNMEFFDESTGYVSGGGGLGGSGLYPQMTTDGGWTWSFSRVGPSGPPGSTASEFYGPVRFVNGMICTFRYAWIEEPFLREYDGMVLSWNRLQDTVLIRPSLVMGGTLAKGFAWDRWNIWLLYRTPNVRRTSDGGTTWIVDTLLVPISEILCDLYGHRLALGNGRLFRLDVPDAIESAPKYTARYKLGQNYPNPFNPKTRFEYQIPNEESVLLRVFDILGREVETLVKEQQPPGTHHVEFDASNLSSGVYFYRLNSGSFVQTRKLLLLR